MVPIGVSFRSFDCITVAIDDVVFRLPSNSAKMPDQIANLFNVRTVTESGRIILVIALHVVDYLVEQRAAIISQGPMSFIGRYAAQKAEALS